MFIGLAMCKRIGLFLLTALLLCAVSTLEFPELIHLVDNTSNDYSTAIFQKNTSSTLAVQAPDTAHVVVIALPAIDFASPAIQTQPSEPWVSCPDLLPLFCIRRT